MPYKEHMTWRESHKRWQKMHLGTLYSVKCSDLDRNKSLKNRVHVYTRDGSRKAANEWWERRQAELEGKPERAAVLAEYREAREPKQVDEVQVAATEERLRQVIARAERAESLLASIGRQEKAGVPVERIEEVDELASLAPKKAEVAKSFEAEAEKWLGLIGGQIKPLSFREIRDFVRRLYAVPALSGVDVAGVNEDKVEAVFLWLKGLTMSQAAKRKRWKFFVRLVTYFWSKRLIELPRNLGEMDFEVRAKKIRTYPTQEVRDLLGSLTGRLRCYALLGLNCGMLAADVGQLRKDQIDLDAGTLTRKRVKTQDCEDVPTVTYRLWPELLASLREQWSGHDTLALTSTTGTPLWTSEQEGDKTPMKDLVGLAWKKAETTITQKAFRSIAATIMGSHAHYGRHAAYYLGHSPRSVADKHYVAPSDELFFTALDWLRLQFFPGEAK